MKNNIISFKNFYELFLDNLDNKSVTVNTPEYNGIRYPTTTGHDRIVDENSEEYKDMISRLDNNEILVRYPSGVPAVTPGQACVLYLGRECLGSGIIKEVRKNDKKLWYL